MAIKQRKEREREELKSLILGAAMEIITADGIEKLSVRKIAAKIEYSPAIIYHYFKDKNDIINHVVALGYKKIIAAISPIPAIYLPPQERLKQLTESYIEAALSMPREYMAVQLSNHPEILSFTASMFKGASKNNPALAILCACLEDMQESESLQKVDTELTAQIIVCATLGLIIKIIIEDIDEAQRRRLIDHFINETIIKIAGGR